MPSAFSVSSAYVISFRVPSTSGGGMVAKRPNRAGWSRTSVAPYSLMMRLSLRDSSLSPHHAPGCTRQHRRLDAALVDVVERHLRRPFRAVAHFVFGQRLALFGRNEMVMDVDPGLCGLRADPPMLRHRRARGPPRRRRETSAVRSRVRPVPVRSSCRKTAPLHPPHDPTRLVSRAR